MQCGFTLLSFSVWSRGCPLKCVFILLPYIVQSYWFSLQSVSYCCLVVCDPWLSTAVCVHTFLSVVYSRDCPLQCVFTLLPFSVCVHEVVHCCVFSLLPCSVPSYWCPLHCGFTLLPFSVWSVGFHSSLCPLCCLVVCGHSCVHSSLCPLCCLVVCGHSCVHSSLCPLCCLVVCGHSCVYSSLCPLCCLVVCGHSCVQSSLCPHCCLVVCTHACFHSSVVSHCCLVICFQYFTIHFTIVKIT